MPRLCQHHRWGWCWVWSGPKINKCKWFSPSLLLFHSRMLMAQLNGTASLPKRLVFTLICIDLGAGLRQTLPRSNCGWAHGPWQQALGRGSLSLIRDSLATAWSLLLCRISSSFNDYGALWWVFLQILLRTLWRAFIWVSNNTINRGFLSPWSSSLKLHLHKLSSP